VISRALLHLLSKKTNNIFGALTQGHVVSSW